MSALSEFLDGVNSGANRSVELLKLLPIMVAVGTAVTLQTRTGKIAFVLLFTVTVQRTFL